MFDGKAYGDGIVELVKGYVEREIAPLKAENGELKGRIAELEARSVPDDAAILQLVQEEVAKIPAPESGKDADPELVASLVAEEVQRAVAAIPAPQDGKSVGVEDVAPLIAEEVAKAVAEIPVPKDGADGKDGSDGRGVKELLIDREGQLVATMDDGEMKTLGPVVGRDGKPGENGHDGFSLDDFDCQPVDERTIKLMFTRGEVMHSFELEFPVIIDRGVYKEGESYVRGDAVTWGGSLWIAQAETKAKPDGPDSGWRLAVKKGRDGKDAKNG
jgi:hypothetical protein